MIAATNEWGVEVTIGDVSDVAVNQQGPEQDPFLYIDISGIDRERKEIAEARLVPLVEAPSRAKQRVRAGDVLVSMTRPNLNAVALVPPQLDGAIASTGFHVIRSSWLVSSFLYRLVQTDDFIDAMCSAVQGALYPAVRPKDISSFKFILPSSLAQRAIVEKLEELLADLDAGVAELKAAQKKLTQYRQSLLKAAVEGRLTADWRVQHPPTETGAELLARILQERRARWEAKQLEKFAQQDKTPPKNWQHKYPEPVAPDVRNLPKLPEGWVWASVDQLLYGIEAGKSFKCDERPPHGYEVGVIKVSAVTWGEYDENESKTCLDESLICPELFVAEGDFLFSRANTINLIGACVISKKVTKKIMLSDKILRFHFSNDSMKLWLLNLLRSKFGRNQIETFSSGNQESMRNIGQEKIKQIAVPIPSQPEMMHTMNVLTRALNAATHQTAAINFSLKQTTAQRQNILRAAFAGELVSQDPNDEPASVLLARIRAQRAAQPPAKKPRGRKPKEDQHV